MLTVLGSKIAFMLYGAAIGWAVTHWTAVKTAEATVAKFFGKAQVKTAAAPPSPGAPPAA
jgi:hypothetical protein